MQIKAVWKSNQLIVEKGDINANSIEEFQWKLKWY
jgi:hypothetical protein